MKNPEASSIYKKCQWPDKVCKPIRAMFSRQREPWFGKGGFSLFQCRAFPNDNEKSGS